MGFIKRVSAVTKRQMANLQAAHDRRVKEAEVRTRAKLEVARTKGEREKAKLALEREKLNLKRELYEAKIATQKASAAVKKARLEAGDLTIGERAEATWRALSKPKKARRTTAKKKTVTRKRR